MTEETRTRVSNSKEVIGHPHNFTEDLKHNLDVHEGEHYKVLAYTDWGSYFVPTVIKWSNGELDSFESLSESKQNKADVLEY